MKPLHFAWTIVVFFSALTVWAPPSSIAAGRIRAEVTCEPAEDPLVYHCTIRLTDRKTGRPIEGAIFKMHTSMPSMPMAHYAPPVEGKPGTAPGVYHATFHFAMAGRWMIDIRTTVPSRDQVQHMIMVPKKGAPPERGKHEMQMQKMQKTQKKHQQR